MNILTFVSLSLILSHIFQSKVMTILLKFLLIFLQGENKNLFMGKDSFTDLKLLETELW